MLRPGSRVRLDIEVVTDPNDDEAWGVTFHCDPAITPMDVFQLWVFIADNIRSHPDLPMPAERLCTAAANAFEAVAIELQSLWDEEPFNGN